MAYKSDGVFAEAGEGYVSSDGVADHSTDPHPGGELEHLGDEGCVQFQVPEDPLPHEETEGEVTGLQVLGEPAGEGDEEGRGRGGEGRGGQIFLRENHLATPTFLYG